MAARVRHCEAPPAVRLVDGVAHVPVSNGRAWALVDPEDVPLVEQHRWYLHSKGYAVNRAGQLMHRLILGFPASLVDHKSRDRLDNRRANLRPATRIQSIWNQRQRATAKSGFKGVYLNGKRWEARIRVNGDLIARVCGSREEAARVYDEMAIEHRGEWAVTNKALGLISY